MCACRHQPIAAPLLFCSVHPPNVQLVDTKISGPKPNYSVAVTLCDVLYLGPSAAPSREPDDISTTSAHVTLVVYVSMEFYLVAGFQCRWYRTCARSAAGSGGLLCCAVVEFLPVCVCTDVHRIECGGHGMALTSLLPRSTGAKHQLLLSMYR
eukprot:TRINITY_DN409_c0_g1_i3.p1 TRINITY_DN409_c0_g1~~TRINITY_DN409_c0_g1_i3.p1  ORF type:complete len:153 (+),score=6.78 TRINITY_DN409_c0_g1_i3:488-946(+)